jgi:plastocyanin
MLKRRLIVFAVALASLIGGAFAGSEHVVSQKDKKFSVSRLKVKVGDTVSFRNDDPFFHNIFSLSPTQSFDIGSFAKGESRKVVFSKQGTVEVECAIHPEMKLTVEVAR